MKTILQPNFNFYQSANEQGEKIAENFIVRKVEFETVMDDIRSNSMEGSIQHFLFLGRRGSGKSTLLKRIEYEIEIDKNLSKYLIPINLAEEQANIYRLYDLWEEIITELKSRGIEIETCNLDEDDTYEYNRQLYQLIHDALAKHKKKIVLLLDNIDRVFENVGDDSAQLREVLLNYKDIKIIGGSTRMSEHFWSYAKPFYNFFRVIKLGGLDSQEIRALLLHWSEIYNLPQLKDFVENKPGQIETIRIMTDGLPRTLKFFISLIVNRSQKDSYGYLRQILDYLTPLYQERLNSLPSAHRKIVLQLAFIWESTEVKTLADACKMPSGLVSAHLKQLTDNGIVSKIETGKRKHFYKIEERFFNLWLIFTQGSPSDKRKQKCLTIFLENWYDKKEIKNLAVEHLKLLENQDISANDVALFSKALVHSKYITLEERDEIIEKTLKLDGLADDLKKGLPNTVYDKIYELIEIREWSKAMELIHSIEQEDGRKENLLGYIYLQRNEPIKAEKYFKEALIKGETDALYYLGSLYSKQGKFNLAEKYYLDANKEGNVIALYNLGLIYVKQEKYILAEKCFFEAIQKGYIDAFNNLGLTYEKLEKYDLAEKYLFEAIKNKDTRALYNLASFYYNQEKYELSEKYYLEAIKKKDIDSIYNLALLYDEQERYKLAEKYYVEAIKKGIIEAIYNLALLYDNQGRYDLAEKYYLKSIKKGSKGALNNLGLIYDNQEKYDLAEKYYQEAINNGNLKAANNLGLLYSKQGKYKLAKKLFLEAIENKNIKAYYNLAILNYQMNEDKEESLNLISKYINVDETLGSKMFQIILSVWNGKFANIKEKIFEIIYSHENAEKEFLLLSLLIHHQKSMVLNLFEDEKLKEQFIPLYYSTLLLENEGKDENILLKIPSELLSTVQEIIASIKEKQEFYYPVK